MHNAVKMYGGVEVGRISSSSKLNHRCRCGQFYTPLPYARSHGTGGWMGHRSDDENKNKFRESNLVSQPMYRDITKLN
jgi:hypothetical protein